MKPGVFIDGEWDEGRGQEIGSIDPSTDEEVWRINAADDDDVGAACAAAAGAFGAWSQTPLEQRIAILEAYRDILVKKAPVLAKLISREMGKPLWDSETEVQAMIGKIAISIAAHTERTGERRAQTAFGAMALTHRPHGVMAVLGPFNFPGHLPNGHIVPALLAGNTIVFKPSEYTPAIGIELVLALSEAGIPDGVVNLVNGARQTGAALLQRPELAGVLFTGSATVGKEIHRQFAGRPEIILALEMGGNNPLIVWPPTDPAAAASLILHSAFITSGQRCSCARRVILPRGAAGDAIVDALAALSDRVVVGRFDQEPQPFMGPLVSRRAAIAARAFEADLVAVGGESIRALGGEGAFVRPAIVALEDAAIAPDEECFAPLVQILRAATLDEAISMANQTRFGLAGGLISDDPDHWSAVHARLRAGVLNWNRATTGASSLLPFGGPGLSGSGRPSAYYAADYCAWPVASQIAEVSQAQETKGLRG